MKYDEIQIGTPLMVGGERWEIYAKTRQWIIIKSPKGKLKKVTLGRIQIAKTMNNYKTASPV